MIQFSGASYSYGDRPLLSGLSFELQPGSFHFLTGPSGSGKTTLLRLCHLELAPDEGQMRLFEEDAVRLGRDEIAGLRQRIGMVHQDTRFLDHLSVRENLALPLVVGGRPTEAEEDNLEELLNWTGLSDRADARPPELSGGERQRAALARAVITSPDIILADEPTGNVDWDMSLRLLGLLIELNRLGRTVLIATHDMNLIRQVKSQVQARVLRIRDRTVELAGADL